MSEPIVDFFVPGIPRSGGSKRGFVNPKNGRVIITESSNKLNKDWRASVQHFAFNVYHGSPLDIPLRVSFEFRFPRPQSHFGTGRNAGVVKDSAPPFPAGRPDTTKLVRPVEDALTGIIWTDDARIVEQFARKVYSERPGCRLIVERMARMLPAAEWAARRLFDRQEAAPC